MAKVSYMSFTRLLQAYHNSLHSNPLRTKALTACVLFTIGDTLSQYIMCKLTHKTLQENWNPRRCFNMAIFGLAYSGPILHMWLTHILPRLVSGTGLKLTLKKVALDQLFFGPYQNAMFFTIQTLLNGGDFQAVKHKLEANWWITLKRGWCFWMPTNLINFYFIPIPYQPLFIGCASILWSSFTSYMQYARKID